MSPTVPIIHLCIPVLTGAARCPAPPLSPLIYPTHGPVIGHETQDCRDTLSHLVTPRDTRPVTTSQAWRCGQEETLFLPVPCVRIPQSCLISSVSSPRLLPSWPLCRSSLGCAATLAPCKMLVLAAAPLSVNIPAAASPPPSPCPGRKYPRPCAKFSQIPLRSCILAQSFVANLCILQLPIFIFTTLLSGI